MKRQYKLRLNDDDGYFSMRPIGSGKTVSSAITHAQSIAKSENVIVRFTFNYCDHFEVRPDGTWTCERDGGGMPVCGPNSEFVPKEGWMAFYGH